MMVNMPYADEAAALAKEKGVADRIGLHLNLTEGFPMTVGIKSSGLFCNKDGSFNRVFHSGKGTRLHLSSKTGILVKKEIEAQIQRYISYGFPLMHLDSHHSVHIHLSIFNIICPYIRKYGFKSIRRGRNMAGGSAFSRLKKAYCSFKVKRTGAKTTDYQGSINEFLVFRENISADGSVEIMTHPVTDPITGNIIDINGTEIMEMEELSQILAPYMRCSMADLWKIQ